MNLFFYYSKWFHLEIFKIIFYFFLGLLHLNQIRYHLRKLVHRQLAQRAVQVTQLHLMWFLHVSKNLDQRLNLKRRKKVVAGKIRGNIFIWNKMDFILYLQCFLFSVNPFSLFFKNMISMCYFDCICVTILFIATSTFILHILF